MHTITVFDSDASNPYSEELSGVLAGSGIQISFLGPADHHLASDKMCLRPRFRRSTLIARVREASSLTRLAMRTSVTRPVIVVWARPYQKLMLSFLGLFRKNSVYYIVHNPEESRWPVGLRRKIEELLLGSSQPIVHSNGLRLKLLDFGPYSAKVVVHPPYVAWQSRLGASHTRRDADGERLNLLVLGRLEPDKFRSLAALVGALDKLPNPSTLRLLVRPAVASLPSTVRLTLEDRSRNDWVPDAELAESLRWADVMIAPYEAVTESGTVQLALTLGLRVVAFRGGALDQSLVPRALAQMGDFDDLTRAIIEVTRSQSSTSKWTAQARAAECLETWRAVFNRVS